MKNFSPVDHHSLSPSAFVSAGSRTSTMSLVQDMFLRNIVAKQGSNADAKLHEFNRKYRGGAQG